MHANAEQSRIQQSRERPDAASRTGAPSGGSVLNSAMLSMMGEDGPPSSSADELGERMRSRLPSVRQRPQAQIPQAEHEADRLSASVTEGSPEAVKAAMGRKMGADFSGVRFHTGPAAAAKADAMGARAYTSGADIYFGEGGFDPSVAAHELVHTAQQGMVSSGLSTVAAPAGGVQMLPKWMEPVKRFFSRGSRHQDSQQAGQAARAEVTQPQPQPIGTSMSNLGGGYSADEMRTRTAELLPLAREEIASHSAGKDVGDGNRFFFMRSDSTGTAQGKETRKQYVNMMKRAGRATNIRMLGDMSQDLDALPVVDDLGSYKDFSGDDQRRSAYQDRSVAMTQQYLGYLEQDQDALDALKQSAEGLYGALGSYSEGNRAGMAHGKLEAAHRAMNDMILRSFGGDTVTGRRDLALQASDDKKVAITGQAMATMQPRVLAAVMDPDKAEQLTPQEQQLAVMYQQFFERAGMVDPVGTAEGTQPGAAPSPVEEQPDPAPPVGGEQAPATEPDGMDELREAAERYRAEPDPGKKMFFLRRFPEGQRMAIKRLAGELPPAAEATTPKAQERMAEDPAVQDPDTISAELAQDAGQPAPAAQQAASAAGRQLQPPAGEFSDRSYEKETEVHRASLGKINDAVAFRVNGLKTALSDKNLGALKDVPELSEALSLLRTLAASGKDYTATREGRQYLLGVYSTAEHALSRYITDTMQGYAAAGQANEKYKLQDMPTYENFTQLLYSIRNEHARTVDAVARETRANPQSDELPVYEGDIEGKDRAKKMQAWRFLTGSDRVVWDNGSQKNDQFRSEILGHSAKMLETDVGTELWNLAEASGKDIKFVPHSAPQAGAYQENMADFKEVPDGETGGHYLRMQPEASNIREILKAAAYNRRSEQNPDGFDGVELEVDGQVKRYRFGQGGDVFVNSDMGADLARLGGDVGDNDVAAQTSPWIIFAHEIGHAVKSMLGSKVAAFDGNGPSEMPIASSDRLNDFNHSSEEMANWYIENDLRQESGTGHKAVYNPYRLYTADTYSETGTGISMSKYLKGVHATYNMVRDYELDQDDPRIESFMREFEDKAGDHPELFSTGDSEDAWDSPQGRLTPRDRDDTRLSREAKVGQRMAAVAENNNMVIKYRERAHRMQSVDNAPREGDSKLNPVDFMRYKVVGEKVKEKQERIQAAFRPVSLRGLEPGLFNKRAYAQDTEMQRIKSMLETYNAQDSRDVSPAQLQYLIGNIDQYIQDNQAARNGSGQHRGRCRAMAQIRGQLQAVLDASRGN